MQCTGVTGAEALIKWPNDIVINGKKICGILTEMSAQFDYINHIVIGIGINVHNESSRKNCRIMQVPCCWSAENVCTVQI